MESVEADPARLAAVQQRRADLTRLVRSYAAGGAADGEGGDVAAVLDWARQAAARLGELDSDDDRIAGLAAEAEQLGETVAGLAGQLTALRKDAAARFAAEVTAELAALAMPHASLTVAVTPQEDFGPHGADEVEIRLAAHPGAPALPLAKGASGGELSRVMLAIEVVFAGADPVPTFVFDEVDAGVGGKAAVEIGRRLARLARLAQVIVVTHLPQVAAFADTHLVVEKAGDGSVTRSGVTRLDDAGRVTELSRMLAGLEDSEYGRAHAGELLTAAAAERAAADGAPGWLSGVWPRPLGRSGRMDCDDGPVPETPDTAPEQARRPPRCDGACPAGPPDQEPDQAPADGRDRHHRPRGPGPARRGGAAAPAGRGGGERRAQHQRPVPEPRPPAAD